MRPQSFVLHVGQ